MATLDPDDRKTAGCLFLIPEMKETWHLHQQQKRKPQRDQPAGATTLPAWGFVTLLLAADYYPRPLIFSHRLTPLIWSHCNEPVKVNHQVKWQSLLCEFLTFLMHVLKIFKFSKFWGWTLEGLQYLWFSLRFLSSQTWNPLLKNMYMLNYANLFIRTSSLKLKIY